jgi:uncharacterized RDD family membrane protein YckC
MKLRIRRSGALGLLVILLIFLSFGYANRDILDLYTYAGAVEHGGKARLFYNSSPVMNSLPGNAVYSTRSVDGVQWEKRSFFCSKNCVVARLGDELLAFFRGSYSAYDLENLSIWKRAGDYPENHSNVVPLWAGSLDNDVLLVGVGEGENGSEQTLAAFRVTAEGLQELSENATLKLDRPIMPGIRVNDYFTGAVAGSKAVFFFKDSRKGVIKRVILENGVFGPPVETEFQFRRFAVGNAGGRVFLAGLPQSGNEKMIFVHELGSDFSPVYEWKIDPDIPGIFGRKEILDLGFGSLGDRPLLFIQAGWFVIYAAPIPPEGDAGFAQVVRISPLREFLIKGWAYLTFILACCAVIVGLVTMFRKARPKPAAAPPEIPLVVASFLPRGAAFMTDMLINGVAGFMLMLFVGILKPDEKMIDPLVPEVLIMLCFLVYSFAFETIFGWTPGKRLMRIRTVTESGGRPTFFSLLVRNCFKIVLELIFIESLVFIMSNRNQRLGDMVTGTIVVMDPKIFSEELGVRS